MASLTPPVTFCIVLEQQPIALNLPVKKLSLSVSRKQRSQFSDGSSGFVRQLGEGMQQTGLGVVAVDHQNPIDLDGVETVCLRFEECRALADRTLNQRILIVLVRDFRPVVAEEYLVEASPLIKRSKC